MWIDAHLDLAYCAVTGRDLSQAPVDRDAASVTLPTLRAGDVRVAFATIFTAPDHLDDPAGYGDSDDVEGARSAGRRQLDCYEALAEAGAVRLVRSGVEAAACLDPAAAAPLPGLLLLMEGADPIASPEDVAWWHDRGLRAVGLTWATGTRYAGGNASGGGLTPLGRNMVAALDAAGIIHDASHLSDAAFDDVLACSTGPIMASHSNCRALVKDDQRHLRDDQVRALAARGAVIGVNLFSAFLTPGRRAGVEHVVAQVDRIAELCGNRGQVGLGSDMDGGFAPTSLPEHLDGPDRLQPLADALSAAGWSDEEVHGFRCGNWLRFLQEALPVV